MFNNKMEGYNQEMSQLQEKLRKSEQERFRLEEKFNEMMRFTRDTEQERLRSLRHKYQKFIEQDRKRQERNAEIFRTLDRIETKAATLAAKTNRYRHLREQYALQIKNKEKSAHYEQNTYQPQERNYEHEYEPTCRRKLFPEKTRNESYDSKIAKSKINMLEQYIKENNETEKFLNNIADKITEKNISKTSNYDHILDKIIRNTANDNYSNQSPSSHHETYYESRLQRFPRYQYEEEHPKTQLEKEEHIMEYLPRNESYSRQKPTIEINSTKDEIDYTNGYENDLEQMENQKSQTLLDRKGSLLGVPDPKTLERYPNNTNEVQNMLLDKPEQQNIKGKPTPVDDFLNTKTEPNYMPPEEAKIEPSTKGVDLPQKVENTLQNGVRMVEQVEKTQLDSVLNNQKDNKVSKLHEMNPEEKDNFTMATSSFNQERSNQSPVHEDQEKSKPSEPTYLGQERPKEPEEIQINQQGLPYQGLSQEVYENQELEEQYLEEPSKSGEQQQYLQQTNQYTQEQSYQAEQDYQDEQNYQNQDIVQENHSLQEDNYVLEQNLDQGEVFIKEQGYVDEQNPVHGEEQPYVDEQNLAQEQTDLEQSYVEQQNSVPGEVYSQEQGYIQEQSAQEQSYVEEQNRKTQEEYYNQEQGYTGEPNFTEEPNYFEEQNYPGGEQNYIPNQEYQEQSYGEGQGFVQEAQYDQEQNLESAQEGQYNQDQQYASDEYPSDQQYNQDQSYPAAEQYDQDQPYTTDQEYNQGNQDQQYKQEYTEQYDPNQQYQEGYDQYDPSYQNYEYQQENPDQTQYRTEEYQQNPNPNQQYVENPQYNENYEQIPTNQAGQQVEYTETTKQGFLEDSFSSADNVGNIDTILGGTNEELPIAKTNLGKLLESDTESSLKQDTKVSNDSDFDFSQNN